MKRILVVSALAALGAMGWAQAKALPRTIRLGEGGQQEQGTQHPSHAGTKNGNALKLLLESMSRFPKQDVQVIITQRDYASNVMQQIKVEMSRAGQVHQLVLAPVSKSGTELVDDGHVCKTYSPDERCIIEQPSPGLRARSDLNFRKGLLERNYTLHMERKDRIAGREVVVVMAVPHDNDLDSRCYWVDEENGFLLRMDTCREGAAPQIHFETKMVTFLTEFPEGSFHLDEPRGVMTRRYESKCLSPGSAKELVGELGFVPVIPGELPMGFAAQELQASSDSDVPAVAIRITDGLAKATIMEWQSKGHTGKRAPAGTIVRNAGGLTLLISGDLREEVKAKLINSFAQAAKGEPQADEGDGDVPMHLRAVLDIEDLGVSWALELRCEVNALGLDRDPVGIAPMIFATRGPFRF